MKNVLFTLAFAAIILPITIVTGAGKPEKKQTPQKEANSIDYGLSKKQMMALEKL